MALLCQYLRCSNINAFVPNNKDFADSRISAHPIYRKDGRVMRQLMTNVKTIEFGIAKQIGNVVKKKPDYTFLMLTRHWDVFMGNVDIVGLHMTKAFQQREYLVVMGFNRTLID